GRTPAVQADPPAGRHAADGLLLHGSGPDRRNNHISTPPVRHLADLFSEVTLGGADGRVWRDHSATRDRCPGLGAAMITRPRRRGSRRVTMSHACSAV